MFSCSISSISFKAKPTVTSLFPRLPLSDGLLVVARQVGDDLPVADPRQDNSRALRASGQFPSSVSKVQKMLAKVTTQWRVSSGAGSSKRGSKRGGRLPSRGLAARLHAPPTTSSSGHQSKRGEMGKLVQEIHQMVRKLHKETDKQKSGGDSHRLFSSSASSPTFGNGVSKVAAASNFLNKRGLQPEYYDPVEEKIDEILAMIR